MKYDDFRARYGWPVALLLVLALAGCGEVEQPGSTEKPSGRLPATGLTSVPTTAVSSREGDGQQDDGSELITRTYDIRSLIGPAKDDPTIEKEVIKQIMQIVQTNVGPGTWKETGGEQGSIQEVGGDLIVTHTRQRHDEIAKLLGEMRAR